MDPSAAPSENSPSILPVRPARGRRYVQRTVTFNVGHPEDEAKFQAARTMTRSFGAADSYDAQHRKQFLKKPKEKLTTTYTSCMLEDETLQERSPTSSPAFKRVGARRHRLNRHQSLAETDGRETVRPSVKVSSRNQLGRHHSALDSLSKKNHDDNSLVKDSSISSTTAVSTGRRKVRLSSSRMWTYRRQNGQNMPQHPEEDDSDSRADYPESSSEGTQQPAVETITSTTEINKQPTASSISTDDSTSLDSTICNEGYCQYDLLTVDQHRLANTDELPSAVVRYSPDDCSTGYSSWSSTNIDFLHDWRPSPPSDLLQCCGCDRCSLMLKAVSHHKSYAKSSTASLNDGQRPRTTLSNRTSEPHLGPVCLTPAEALVLFGPHLTAEEKMEIEFYPEIYYIGADKKRGQLRGGHAVTPYEDESGNYRKVLYDHLAYRYEILEFIGAGVTGQVVRSLDHKNGKQVAIKILRNTKCCTRQGLYEIRMLDRLRRMDPQDQGNAVRLVDYFYFRNHLCISMELLGTNLHQLLESNNFVGFDQKCIRKLARSMIQCLQFLLRQRIIHGDLKPENIMLKNPKSWRSAKLIDFGSACYTSQWLQCYVQSRFYRSPEVILGLPYGCPIDMWSFGCILAELHTGHPIFRGENEAHQFLLFGEVLGTPPRKMIAGSSRKRLYFDSKGNAYPISDILARVHQLPGSRNLASVLKDCDPAFLDFVSRCLEWDPTKRMTPDEACRHEWLAGPAASYPSERPGNGMPLDSRQQVGFRKPFLWNSSSSCCIA